MLTHYHIMWISPEIYKGQLFPMVFYRPEDILEAIARLEDEYPDASLAGVTCTKSACAFEEI